MSAPLPKKLGMKAEMCGLVLAAPDDYLDLLKPLPDGFRILSKASGTYPFVQVFINRLLETAKCAKTFAKHAAPNALLWIAYPKKTSGRDTDLGRDSIREKMSGLGWNAVSIVAINETWAALRFRPVESRGRIPQIHTKR